MRILKSLLPIVAALFVLTPRANAQFEIDYFSQANFIQLAGGTTLAPVGDAVLLGTFNSSFTFSLSDTFATLMAQFVQYDATSIGAFPGSGAGQFGATTLFPDTFRPGPPADHLFIWVFNNANPALATQWAIITSNSANWFRPANGGFTAIDSGEVSVFHQPGTIGSIAGGDMTGGNVIMGIAPIPEPSTYFLGLVGGTAMIGALRLRRMRVRC